MGLKESLVELVKPVIESAGYYLEDVFTSNPGNHRIVTCMIDSSKPMSLDEISTLSREISALLDDANLIDQAFTLEVTSPGIERPLTLPRHWAKNITRIIRVVSNDGPEISGRLSEFNEERVVLIENIKGRMKTHEINFCDIKIANVEVEFNRKEEI